MIPQSTTWTGKDEKGERRKLRLERKGGRDVKMRGELKEDLMMFV